MKSFTILLISFVLTTLGFAQSTLRHTVHFDSDRANIDHTEQQKLAAFTAQLGSVKIQNIEITGHTDSDGSDEYNLNLSKRRVKSVQKEISKLDLNYNNSAELFLGEKNPVESNANPQGKHQNRRVEIIVTLVPIAEVEPIESIPVVMEIEKPELEGDTLIEYPEGTLIELPKKDYFDNPDCISMVEYLDGESVREAGLTTMTSDGASLISGGMLNVKMCDEGKCVTVLIPFRTVCGQNLPFTQWTAEANNTWTEKSRRPLPIRMINDRAYYEMTVCGSGGVNCDVRVPEKKCKLFTPKTRIKLKNGYQIKHIQLASDEPMMLESPIRRRKRKAVFFRTCPCTKPLVYVEAFNRNGEIDTIEFSPLNEFDKREAFGKCKEDEVEKKILFFKIRKKTKYRKYLIREDDFTTNE